RPAWYWLILTRILLLPVIAGLAYELIRFAGKHTDNRVVMKLLAPGLWLQRLTTRGPALDQIEVSIRRLREAPALEEGDTLGAQRVEVMAYRPARRRRSTARPRAGSRAPRRRRRCAQPRPRRPVRRAAARSRARLGGRARSAHSRGRGECRGSPSAPPT